MMKTPITVLQELMVKFSESPEYECVAQSGPQHLAVFEYRCAARGHVVSATARSKKEAKQEVARLMLARLAAAGLSVPPPYAAPAAAAPLACDEPSAGAVGTGSRSYKALLKELCQEYNLPGPEYTLEGDTGPAHARRFTARCAVGAHARIASATTKKAAQQLAAQQLYQYLRENLARLTEDFVEEDALARAHERAMERYVEARADAPHRPDLGQCVADYHLEEEQVSLGADALEAASPDAEPETALQAVAGALGLRVEWHSLPAEGGALTLVRLAPSSPPLVFCARTRDAAAAEALTYLRLTMKFKGQK
ncbi:RISC-loading complex subunit TARBP2-like isoform X2 [Leguminivora glycinivorella]|uniref:RISC-loading complex subunit TARBP2-like isoform X2 n=1 Tax=Leguminivora glycinivorella TaxID=1035111 RepID=UPI00200FCE86|nr:RISC-loading complex subunit TARBP2-like isoform X2 [Leguminivora glycinivorella]